MTRGAVALLGLAIAACDRGPSAAEIDRLHAEAVAANEAKLGEHAADDANAPGKTLTIDGQIGAPGATFDWAALEALATTHVPTKNPQNPTDRARVIDFRGVLVRDLLDRFQAAPDATEVTFVALDGFRSTVDVAGLRRYRVLLAIAADNAPIDRAAGGPIYLVFPHSEAPETETTYPDRYWSFYVTHLIIGTEAARVVVGDKVLDAAALAALPRVTLEQPVGWKVHWPSSAVRIRGVKLTDALAAAGVTVPPGGKVIVRGKASIHRDPKDPVVVPVADLERCGFVLATHWGDDDAPITAKLGGPVGLAVPQPCAADYGDSFWITFVEELVVEP
ncbi:MAG TPA: molybdopterin-dependent oxidoreductase [Kofleriaceae bacterium]|nr:molybdopterin-dependent oxidoreductase [Kofleriaceae bacterium]